ncbi:MAG: hypothetical protein EXR62_09465 [Chloroflexi bacterium]|nr:hypothetical protein [Chloroflexota bacterium]
MSDLTVRRELAMNRAIDRHLDAVVRHAGSLAEKLKDSGMKENQIRNVLNVASETESIEALANFIRYQIGRSAEWGKQGFGDHLVAAFAQKGEVYRLAGEAAQQVYTDLQGGADAGETMPTQEELFTEARIRLARLLIGYLNRCFQYSKKTGVWTYAL